MIQLRSGHAFTSGCYVVSVTVWTNIHITLFYQKNVYSLVTYVFTPNFIIGLIVSFIESFKSFFYLSYLSQIHLDP